MSKDIRFETQVNSARYDENKQHWVVETETADGSVQTHTANVVISAAGAFNPPVYPDIDGVDRFEGESWHTAHWWVQRCPATEAARG